MEKTVIVIDDEFQDRQSFYKKVLSDYSIRWVGSQRSKIAAFKELHRATFVILDKVLNKIKTGLDSAEVLRELTQKNQNIPVIMISKFWLKKEARGDEMVQYAKEHTVIDFLSWEEYSDAAGKTSSAVDELADEWKERIETDIEKFSAQIFDRLCEDEKIDIVHLSDLHFGGKHAETVTNYAVELPRSIFNIIKNTPKLLLISGDSAEKGKHENFDMAKDWINRFIGKLNKENTGPKTSVIIANGNHDCNLSTFAKFCYEYSHSGDNCFVYKNDISQPTNDYAGMKISRTERDIFSEFFEFKESVIQERLYKQTSMLNFVCDYFLPWGIRIVCLNTVNNISPVDTKNADVSNEAIASIIETCTNLSYEKTSVFTILLTHHGPHDLGYGTGSDKVWPKITDLFFSIGINLWLCGHIHDTGPTEIDINKSDETRKVIVAQTSSLLGKEISANAERGFNLISLVRENGIVKEVEITPVETKEFPFRSKKTKKFIVD
jgi:CheY-like chemotaxis protein/predicted MPP superfamily phosphohydrolase